MCLLKLTQRVSDEPINAYNDVFLPEPRQQPLAGTLTTGASRERSYVLGETCGVLDGRRGKETRYVCRFIVMVMIQSQYRKTSWDHLFGKCDLPL